MTQLTFHWNIIYKFIWHLKDKSFGDLYETLVLWVHQIILKLSFCDIHMYPDSFFSSFLIHTLFFIIIIITFFCFNTFEFYSYTDVPLKLNSRHFHGIQMYLKNYSLGISSVHIEKCKNCLYVYYLNINLLLFIFTFHNCFYINRKSKRFLK